MSGRGRRELSIFVFIDALGWQVYQRNQAHLLTEELQIAHPMDTVLGYSCACDPTILTGRLPQEHGHFSFYQFAPQRSPFASVNWVRWLKWLPARLRDHGRVRRQLSKLLARHLGFDGYFQLYNMPWEQLPWMNYSEQRDLYQPGGIIAGCPTIFDKLDEADVSFHVSDWRNSEVENLRRLEAEIQQGEISWAYLYLADLDGILHRDGPGQASEAAKVRWYDVQLRKLLKRARQRYEHVSLSLFSDHGMTEVRSVCNLMDTIDRVAKQHDLVCGRDYGVVYDSTMARFWLCNEKADRVLRFALHGCPDGRVLADSELQALGCLFPHREYGDLFFLLDPGVLLCPSHMGRTPLRGMHGYRPDHEDSTAFFASTEYWAPPRRLDDIFPLMLEAAVNQRDNTCREQRPLAPFPARTVGSGK